MNILGLDGGMTRLGFGAVKKTSEGLELLTHGLISHPRDFDQKFNDHLNTGIHQITVDFPRLLNIVQPDLIFSELIPAGKLGANDSLVIAAITTCKVIAFQFGIEWRDIAAVTVKKEFTGNYRATKTVVRNTVFDLFPVVEGRHLQLKKDQKQHGEKTSGLPYDVTDALSIAVVGAKLYEEKTVPKMQEAEA